MTGVLIALLVAGAAIGTSLLLRRRPADPPTQTTYQAPQQLDRADFDSPERPWLVAVFTSATCDSCREVKAKAEPLRSAHVAVDEIDWQERPELHRRYGVDAVPMIVIADAEGVVRSYFIGPVSVTDLWAAVAEAREPGSTPPPEAHTHWPM